MQYVYVSVFESGWETQSKKEESEPMLVLSGLSVCVCVWVLSGTSQTGRPSSHRHRCLPGRWASVSLSVSLSLSLWHTPLPAPSRPPVPGTSTSRLCVRMKARQIWRGRKYTHTHTRPHAAFSRGEEEGREEEREKKRCPRLPSHPSIQHFSSFRLVPFIRQFFPFCAVPYAAALSLPPLFSCPPFLCAPSFFSPIASLPFFPIHPLFLLASFQFPSAWTRGLPLRSLLRECGELK